MYDHELDVEHGRENRDGVARQARPRGTPGRSTLTARMPPTAAAIARAVVMQLRLSQLDEEGSAVVEPTASELAEAP